MFSVLTLVICSLLLNCIAGNNELKLEINILERSYSPTNNQLSFKAECRVPSNGSLTENEVTWYLRRFFHNSTHGTQLNDHQYIPTSKVKKFENYIVGYTSMSFSVEVKEIELYCLVPGFHGVDKLLFRYSNHQVVGANTIIYSDLNFDTTNQVNVSVKTSELFNVSWKIDDTILLPGDTKDNIKVLRPESSENNIYKVPLLFSPLKSSDAKRKYILMLDFLVSGYSAHYNIYIEEKFNGIMQGPILPYIIGLSVGIVVTSFIVFVVWLCCRRTKSTNNQRHDGKSSSLNTRKISKENNPNESYYVNNLSNQSYSDKYLDKLYKDTNENICYSVPYEVVKDKYDSTGNSMNHYQNIDIK